MKQKFDIIGSTCVPLPLENVDTDQIIPARFLKATTRDEKFFGDNLFRDWRYNADGSNQETGSPIHGITGEWKTFTLELEYTKEPDPEVLKNMGYSMIIGFSSGWQGADFRGALDSKFYIDNIVIEMQKDERDGVVNNN